VDLNSYSGHLNRAVDALHNFPETEPVGRTVATMAESPVAVAAPAVHTTAPPAVGVSRRPLVELPLPGVGVRASAVASGEKIFEASSPLDVPAFLRRQT
jgi:hypothetical protein